MPNSQKRSLDAVAVADLLLRKYMVYKNDINTIKYHVQYLYSMQNNISISICIYCVIV